ncbi:MAG: hypothetical protein J0L75_07115 [Spirochaetes bacterium]|nr:hypothetical protein [Spirochaetota bacterium]
MIAPRRRLGPKFSNLAASAVLALFLSAPLAFGEAPSPTLNAHGWTIQWKNDRGFSLAHSGKTLSAASLLLCMEPPWKSHWFYPVKTPVVATTGASSLQIASDPSGESVFSVSTYGWEVLSPGRLVCRVRGELTKEVTAFVTHVFLTVPAALLTCAQITAQGSAPVPVTGDGSSPLAFAPARAWRIQGNGFHLAIRVTGGPDLIWQDRRMKPYLGERSFILMEAKGFPVAKGASYSQEIELEYGAELAAAPLPMAVEKEAVLRTSDFFAPAAQGPGLEALAEGESAYDGVFSWDDYRLLLAELRKPRYKVATLGEFSTAPASEGGAVLVGMRHDIDSHPEKALAMARIEKEAGLPSTYFILHSAPYYAKFIGGRLERKAPVEALARFLAKEGFELGIHTDLFSMMWNRHYSPAAFLREELAQYAAMGIPVKGAAAHGDGAVIAAGLNNMWIFSEFGKKGTAVRDGERFPYGESPISEFGLAYEAYLLNRDVNTGDIDSRLKGKPVAALIDLLAAIPAGRRAILLTHPEHWGKKP